MAQTRTNLLDLVDLAYDLEGTVETWLGRVIGAVDEVTGATGRGLGFTFATDRAPHRWVREVAGVGVSQAELAFMRAAYRRPTLMRGLASFLGPPDTMPPMMVLSQAIARVPLLSGIFRPFARRFGFDDLVALAAHDGSGAGIIINLAMGIGHGPVAETERATRLRRVRAALPHLSAGLRLRRALASPEVVLAVDGRVRDGEVSSDGRERLRAAVLARDRAHTRAGRDDPEAALAAWSALVEGRWTLVDRFERSGERFVVAIPNLPDVTHPRRLAPLERAVLALLMLGRSNKAIAYELGLAPGTVAAYVSEIRRKLAPVLDGLAVPRPTRVERHGLGDLELYALVSVIDGDDDLREPLLARLPAAEREVARLAVAGLSNADIAAARGVSERTVANQLASAYRRLEVGSRRDLAARLARGDRD